MQGNFSYYNPTKLYFGEHAITHLKQELTKYGPTILLVYGGGSIKRNGIYQEVYTILNELGKTVIEDGGVMSNPTVDKLYAGCELIKKHSIDFILAVGGGSVIDYAKALSACAYCPDDAWTKYYLNWEDVTNPILPIGCVLTMVGTGSEMNTGSVITNTEQKLKIGRIYDERFYPKFTILDPTYTYSLPHYQMVAGIFDTMSHILEQYLSGTDDSTSDYLAEGLMQSLITSSKIAIQNPTNYEARSNLMWIASWALNTLIEKGKPQDWTVHNIGETIGAYTNATHGMTLSCVSLAYYRKILPYGLSKFVRFAKNVWNISTENKTDEDIAYEGLQAMEQWMHQLQVVTHLQELGVTKDMLEPLAKQMQSSQTAYHQFNTQDFLQILNESW